MRSFVVWLLLVLLSHQHVDARSPFLGGRWHIQRPNHASALIFSLRGGASKKSRRRAKTSSLSSTKTVTGKKKVQAAEKEKKVGAWWKAYKGVMPMTRIYITAVVVMTGLGFLLGEELAQGLLALDPIRFMYGLELWRPFTAATFLGPPSLEWLFSGYYLFQYGSQLERAYGTAQHVIFLLTQIVVLSFMSIMMGQPFYTGSVITAMLHVLSRATPDQNAKLLIFNVPYWSLPYGLMGVDVLKSQSLAAAVPHIIGILSGHVYFFHRFVWPKLGGEDWLGAPDFLLQRLDPNVKRDTKEAVNSALKRKRSKGRKLGRK